MHPLSWFISKVGTRVYRDKNEGGKLGEACECVSCKDIIENGLIIHDESHAKVLHMYSHGLGINYRDTK